MFFMIRVISAGAWATNASNASRKVSWDDLRSRSDLQGFNKASMEASNKPLVFSSSFWGTIARESKALFRGRVNVRFDNGFVDSNLRGKESSCLKVILHPLTVVVVSKVERHMYRGNNASMNNVRERRLCQYILVLDLSSGVVLQLFLT
jgi:hypothetical protein